MYFYSYLKVPEIVIVYSISAYSKHITKCKDFTMRNSSSFMGVCAEKSDGRYLELVYLHRALKVEVFKC